MLATLLNRPCTITRRLTATAIEDAYGNLVPGEELVQTVCELQQQRRGEPGDQGELSDTRWLLILPAGTAINTGDMVTVDGEDFDLVGDPWHAEDPYTPNAPVMDHVEATLRRTASAADEVGS